MVLPHLTSIELRNLCRVWWTVTAFGLLAAGVAYPQNVQDETPPGVYETFDAVSPSWQIHASKDLAGIQSHRRIDVAPLSGRRSEFLSIIGRRGGERVLATHRIPQSAAIDEFRAMIWLKGNREGYQLLGRVRLPRSLDEDGEPLAVEIMGDRYTTKGIWQRLVLDDVRPKIHNAVRELRISLNRPVDASEAYLDEIALNIFGGAGKNQVQTDDLSLEASVALPFAALTSGPTATELIRLSPEAKVANPQLTHKFHLSNYQFGTTPLTQTPAIQPFSQRQPVAPNFVARAVVYHGESFALLKQLGFNTIWFEKPATIEQLAEAKSLGLWVVAPPQIELQLSTIFESPYEDRILAWNLEGSQFRQAASINARAQSLKNLDPRGRPVVARRGGDESPGYSADVLVNQISTLKTRQVGRDRVRGNTHWASLGRPLVESSRWIRLRQQIWRSVFEGYRGFLLSTTESLEAPSAQHTRHLAELFNLELRMMHPWLGKSELKSESIRTSRYLVYRLSDQHTDLLLVNPADKRQFVGNRGNEVLIPTAHHRDVFRLEPGGLSPVASRRVAGGIRIRLSPEKPDGVFLLTDRSAVVTRMTVYLRSVGAGTQELLKAVIRSELLQLDRKLQSTTIEPGYRNHLRGEVHKLHGRIAWLLDPAANGPIDAAGQNQASLVSFRELDHVLGQLERVHRSLDRDHKRAEFASH